MDDAATQRRFTEAYDSGEVDSDELTTALTRYDSLDADGKAEFDDLLARNGDDAAKLAARTDSDTFDDIMSLGCGPGQASLGSVSSLTDDAYYSVTAPSRTSAALASGSYLSADAKDDFRAGLAKASNDHDVDVEDDFSDVVDAVEALDGDGQRAAVDMVNDLGADGVRVTNGATDLGSRKHSVLTDSEVDDLLTSYDSYRKSDIATRDVADVQKDIDQIAESDVEGLKSAIKSGTGSDTNTKGLDGEVDAATNLLDDGRKIDKLETDIDTSKGETDIDVDLSDGTAIEVKNKNYNEVPEYARSSRESELTKKMEKFAEERDELVIAARGDPSNADVLKNVKNNIETAYPDTNVQLKHIDNVDEV
ncbi:hypothetical protein EGO51_18235 [Haloarcula hispanica]|uniref:Uncharacterized protein n=1 Tax=Haloarcula hispanica TaxID=51589 RepID=A0A5J5LFD9_HALHI|nr:hypothetical protein [Haloarcula hispanica]KAA9404655.1 hypothetical protein EGO51_18235 [Haloarcula hispanica]